MNLFYLLMVAVLQGITEFLPISSSGHLALMHEMSGHAKDGLAIDIAAHVGSLFAVIYYFRTEVNLAAQGCLRLVKGKVDTQGAFLALCLGISTIPVIVMGFLISVTGYSDVLRSVAVIGWATLGFGILLYWADQTGEKVRTSDRWTIHDAAMMGVAQVLALIPGASRSGVTITAARRLGYAREDAARLSMLMSIPTIIASGLVLSADVIGNAHWGVARDVAIASVFSFVAALIALTFMMRLLKSVSFTPYVVYRILLGLILLVYAYS